MKHIKRLSSVLLFFCFLILLSFVIFAHSGNTDKNGGHYDSISDEYHYHHGFPAHQHIDGECPYDFENKAAAASKYSPSDDVSSEQQLDEEKFLATTEIEQEYKKEKSRCIAVFSAIAFVYTYLFGYYYGTEVY